MVRPSRPVSGHVLLIEDDLLERRRVAGQLEALGYDVTLAASGEEGLALLRDGHFDAVVLDLVMPGMSGLEVLRAARSDERLADVPFVVLSALYMTRTERDVLGPKVTDVVRKGDATAEELELAIARAIAQVSSNGARPTTLRRVTLQMIRVVPHWLRLHLPRRLAYPAAGLMLSVALVAGLLTLAGLGLGPGADDFLDSGRGPHPTVRLWLPAGRHDADDDVPGLGRRAKGGPARGAVRDRPADGPGKPAAHPRRVRRGAESRRAVRRSRSRCWSSTSIGSRRSTISTATLPATRRCGWSRRAFAAPAGPTICPPGTVATNSSCWR